MGILSASSSITRYRIADEVTTDLLQKIPDLLVRFGFHDIDDSAEERSFGWVSFDDMLDNKFVSAPPEKGAYFAFKLRLDTRRVSPAVFKKHFALAQRAYLASIEDEEKRYISKDRKKELREQVMLKLRARSLPIPADFDVVWALESHEVWLATTNSKVRGLFEDYFLQSFDLHLEPLTPFFLAARHVGEQNVMRLEALEPTIFSA